jgi:hypothetical protein
MKKLLLSAFFLLTLTTANAQDLLMEDNFEDLTIGNIGTDLTGSILGQGNYLTYIPSAGANSDFQIITDPDPAHGKVLQIIGSPTAGNARFLWKDGLGDLWAARTQGNDILELEFEIFTGPATTSLNTSRITVYDQSSPTRSVLVGISLAQSTKIISGIAYFNNAGNIGNYSFPLAVPQAILPADTWVKIGMSFDYTTGRVSWRSTGYFDGYVMGAGALINPVEIDFVAATATGNALAAVAKFDNFTSRASSDDTLSNSVDLSQNIFSVYPNPASNVVNIENTGSIDAVNIIDINGRVVKKQIFAGETNIQLDVSELASGIYIMNIISEGNVTAKKIVKQ